MCTESLCESSLGFLSDFVIIEADVYFRDGFELGDPFFLKGRRTRGRGDSYDARLLQHHLVEFPFADHDIIRVILEPLRSVEPSPSATRRIAHILVSFDLFRIASELQEEEFPVHVPHGYRDPVCIIKGSPAEFFSRDCLVCDTPSMEVRTHLVGEIFMIPLDILFGDGNARFPSGRCDRLSWLLLLEKSLMGGIVPEMSREGNHIALRSAFFAVVLPRLGGDIEVCLASVAVFVALVEDTTGCDFFSALGEGDASSREVVDNGLSHRNGGKKVRLWLDGGLHEEYQAGSKLFGFCAGDFFPVDVSVDRLKGGDLFFGKHSVRRG